MHWMDAAKIQSYDGDEIVFRDDEDGHDFSDNGSQTPTQGETPKKWRDFIAVARRRVTQTSTTRRVEFLTNNLLSVALTGSTSAVFNYLLALFDVLNQCHG